MGYNIKAQNPISTTAGNPINTFTQISDNYSITSSPNTTAIPQTATNSFITKRASGGSETTYSDKIKNSNTNNSVTLENSLKSTPSNSQSSLTDKIVSTPKNKTINPSPAITYKKPEERTIDVKKPLIALTFDDGPSSSITNRILDLLDKYGIKATFFIVGENLEKYEAAKKTLIRADSLGCEIGNHTYDHKKLNDLKSSDIVKEISKTNSIINSIISKTPTLVRPPYGSYNEKVLSGTNVPLILWSIDTRDWQSRNSEAIIEKVIGNVKNGDIILMHDIYASTAEACEIIIPQLIEQGYQFVTVSELFAYKGLELKANSIYTCVK